MPIRFQVDGDFYDHPKTIDLSDAAVALWTRAGSYSTHKHLDGFVPEGMLARLSKAANEASAELVRARLWRRVRGGFQFHQWDERNLTKDEIEADREYERDRKRRYRMGRREANEAPTKPQRSDVGKSENAPVDNPRGRKERQVKPPSVPQGHDRDNQGTSPGSPNDSVSVSVSVSESVSRGGHAPSNAAEPEPLGPRPPDTCRDHQDDPDPPACRRCKGAREKAEAWDAAYAIQETERRRNAPQCPQHPGMPAHNCGLCRSERIAAREEAP